MHHVSIATTNHASIVSGRGGVQRDDQVGASARSEDADASGGAQDGDQAQEFHGTRQRTPMPVGGCRAD